MTLHACRWGSQSDLAEEAAALQVGTRPSVAAAQRCDGATLPYVLCSSASARVWLSDAPPQLLHFREQDLQHRLSCTYSRDAVLAGGRPHPDQSSAAISTMSGQAVPRSRFQRPHRRLIVCASRHLSTPRAHSNRSAVGVRGAGGGVSLRRRLQKQIVKQVHYRPQQALAPASCSDPRQGGGGEGEGGYWWVGDGASDKAGELAPHWQIHPGRGRAGRRSR